jgi:Transposase.
MSTEDNNLNDTSVDSYTDYPWRVKSLLYDRYVEQDNSIQEIADEFDCSTATVHDWLDTFNIIDTDADEDRPWRDSGRLRELYQDRSLTTYDIADRWDCSHSTVKRWLHSHGIETRSRGPVADEE